MFYCGYGDVAFGVTVAVGDFNDGLYQKCLREKDKWHCAPEDLGDEDADLGGDDLGDDEVPGPSPEDMVEG